MRTALVYREELATAVATFPPAAYGIVGSGAVGGRNK